jgi:serine protease Do
VPNADGQGLLIQDVDQNSVAAEKGFAVGDAILEVNNKPVASVYDIEKAIQSVKDAGRNTALIKASRDGNTRFIGLPITESNS